MQRSSEVYKHLVEQDGYKVMKTFLLTEPSLYIKEMADCQARHLVPAGFIDLFERQGYFDKLPGGFYFIRPLPIILRVW